MTVAQFHVCMSLNPKPSKSLLSTYGVCLASIWRCSQFSISQIICHIYFYIFNNIVQHKSGFWCWGVCVSLYIQLCCARCEGARKSIYKVWVKYQWDAGKNTDYSLEVWNNCNTGVKVCMVCSNLCHFSHCCELEIGDKNTCWCRLAYYRGYMYLGLRSVYLVAASVQ